MGQWSMVFSTILVLHLLSDARAITDDKSHSLADRESSVASSRSKRAIPFAALGTILSVAGTLVIAGGSVANVLNSRKIGHAEVEITNLMKYSLMAPNVYNGQGSSSRIPLSYAVSAAKVESCLIGLDSAVVTRVYFPNKEVKLVISWNKYYGDLAMGVAILGPHEPLDTSRISYNWYLKPARCSRYGCRTQQNTQHVQSPLVHCAQGICVYVTGTATPAGNWSGQVAVKIIVVPCNINDVADTLRSRLVNAYRNLTC